MRLAFRQTHLYRLVNMVGVAGFEPAASWTRTMRDTKLRHTPIPDYYITEAGKVKEYLSQHRPNDDCKPIGCRLRCHGGDAGAALGGLLRCQGDMDEAAYRRTWGL